MQETLIMGTFHATVGYGTRGGSYRTKMIDVQAEDLTAATAEARRLVGRKGRRVRDVTVIPAGTFSTNG